MSGMKEKYLAELENIVGTVCDNYCRFLREGPFHAEGIDQDMPKQCDECDLIKLFDLFDKVCKEG